jgi:hypothetical protein
MTHQYRVCLPQSQTNKYMRFGCGFSRTFGHFVFDFLQLANFLSACGSVEEARKVIKLYYDIRRDVPEIFSQRDPESKEMQQCFQNQ